MLAPLGKFFHNCIHSLKQSEIFSISKEYTNTEMPSPIQHWIHQHFYHLSRATTLGSGALLYQWQMQHPTNRQCAYPHSSPATSADCNDVSTSVKKKKFFKWHQPLHYNVRFIVAQQIQGCAISQLLATVHQSQIHVISTHVHV